MFRNLPHRIAQLKRSRRRFLRAVYTAFSQGAILLTVSDAARGQQKVSKSQAKYQDSPHEGQKCSGCRFFIKPASCQMVSGDISPDGWCQYWVQAS
jgi:hypothetical protein